MGQGLLGPRGWALETGSLVEARLGEAGVGGRRGWALVTWVLEGHIGCPRHLKPVGLGTGLRGWCLDSGVPGQRLPPWVEWPDWREN